MNYHNVILQRGNGLNTPGYLGLLWGFWAFRYARCLSTVPAKQPAARGHVQVLNEVLLAGVLMNHSYLFFSN